METKAHHAIVGFFVVFLTVSGVMLSLWLSGAALDREFREYDVVFDGAVRGLRPASEVRFNGIQVGEVTELGLNPDNPGQVIARIRVNVETPVKSDSEAQLEPQGLTGLSYIQISAGSPDAERLESRPGDRAPRIYATQAQIEQLVEGGESLLESAQLSFVRIGRLLSDENLESMTNTLNNIETITGHLAERELLITEARAALTSVQQAGADVSVAAQAMQQFAQVTERYVVDDLTPATLDTAAAAQEVDRTAVETYDALVAIRPGLEEFSEDGLTQLTATLRDLRSLVATLERVALELESDPAGFIAEPEGAEVEVPR
ncbi:MAG: ABC transporter substrate-binding protein [Oceanicaulis sp.]|uniref:MlaD family protein n=1 Tax=Oceanicaulis TaxID=153232 RepID=UPI000C097F31|nr:MULTISPECIES: MlaD family protein [Oceanicaulis]MAP47929.1 ABC transporter substrate-binding protein [Oceanicaulis sp.]|tara:strand:- start:4215 stop:5171 length:957 start_codon:yes stop_codon:yes gene_type:complete